MNKYEAEKLLKILFTVWSKESSSKWSKENPANGQCGVTSLVVHDLFGGEILKTPTVKGWHYYNRINSERYDFTESQFSEPINYLDIPSNREEAFSDTNMSQYSYLRDNVLKAWKNGDFN